MFKSLTDPQLINCLNNGGVAVLPTDTLYGIMARASDKQAVERVYKIRGRAPDKPCIVLAAGIWQMNDTSLWSPMHEQLAKKYWPGPMSLVTPVTDQTPAYLHRGTHTLAYRVPEYAELRKLLEATGPLIAPSANPEAQPPAMTIQEAEAYFSDKVDGYLDIGPLTGHRPSTVVTVEGHKPKVLRPGAVRIA